MLLLLCNMTKINLALLVNKKGKKYEKDYFVNCSCYDCNGIFC